MPRKCMSGLSRAGLWASLAFLVFWDATFGHGFQCIVFPTKQFCQLSGELRHVHIVNTVLMQSERSGQWFGPIHAFCFCFCF